MWPLVVALFPTISMDTIILPLVVWPSEAQVTHTGFIAQEVEAAALALGYDFSGVDAPKNKTDFNGLRYAEFVVSLVKADRSNRK
jgi:hypothetical protein